jgi:hypothetical protein
MHVYMYTCMYICIHICMCIFMYVCIHANDIQKDGKRHNNPVSKCKVPRHYTTLCTFYTCQKEYQVAVIILSVTGVLLKAVHKTVLVLNMK